MVQEKDDEEVTILERLKYNNIFMVRKNNDGSFTFTENCDACLEAELTKQEVLQLAQELIDLANS